MKYILGLLASALAASYIIFAGNLPHAQADGCVGSWSIGVGGLNDNTSGVFTDRVNQRVGYDSWNPRSGLAEIDRLFWEHRSACPADHIKMLGHSEGAALVHVWVTEHQWVENANAVLLADSKRWAFQGGAGLSRFGGVLGYPLAGVDDWFGEFPVLTLCRWDDWVCTETAPPLQSHVTGSHGWYNFDSWAYGDWGRGQVMI